MLQHRTIGSQGMHGFTFVDCLAHDLEVPSTQTMML